MALIGVAPPARLRGLPESTQRQFDSFYEWILRIQTGETESNQLTTIELIELLAPAVQERFCGGVLLGTTGLGELGWTVTVVGGPGSAQRGNSEPGHFGVLRLIPSGGTPSTIALDNGRSNTGVGQKAGLVVLGDILLTRFVVKYTTQVSVDRAFFGFGDNSAAASAEIGGESVYVGVALGGSFWQCSVRTGSVTTTVTTSVPLVSGAWISWDIQVVSASEIRFFADGTLVHTATSGIPTMTSIVSPSIRIMEAATNNCTLDIDTFQMFLAA